MRKPILSKELIDKFKEASETIDRLENEILALQEVDLKRLRENFLHKNVKVVGQKGWNRGKVWDVYIHGHKYGRTSISSSYGAAESYVMFKVGPSEKSARSFKHDQIELLTDEESADYDNTVAMHERINNRAHSSQAPPKQ